MEYYVCVCACPNIFIPSRSFTTGKCTIFVNCFKTLSVSMSSFHTSSHQLLPPPTENLCHPLVLRFGVHKCFHKLFVFKIIIWSCDTTQGNQQEFGVTATVLTMASKTLLDLSLPDWSLLPFSFPSITLLQPRWPRWPPCCLSHILSILWPERLGTCYSFILGEKKTLSPKTSHDAHPVLPYTLLTPVVGTILKWFSRPPPLGDYVFHTPWDWETDGLHLLG